MTIEDVLKKVEFEEKWLLIAGYNAYNIDIAFHTIKCAIKQLSTESENVGDLITKLKKIKAEMIQERDSVDLSCEDSFNWNIRLIDKYIAELKGESEEEPIKHFGAIECPNCGRLLMLEEQTYSWCKGCKEYDTEKHCCHRYSSFIRESLQDSINAVLEDIKTDILKEINNHSFFSNSQNGLAIAYKIIDNHISGKEQ